MDDVDAQDSRGRTLLMFAIHQSNMFAVQWLLNKGASVSVRDTVGKMCLHHAVRADVGVFCAVLDACPHVLNIPDDFGHTPLHYMAMFARSGKYAMTPWDILVEGHMQHQRVYLEDDEPRTRRSIHESFNMIRFFQRPLFDHHERAYLDPHEVMFVDPDFGPKLNAALATPSIDISLCTRDKRTAAVLTGVTCTRKHPYIFAPSPKALCMRARLLRFPEQRKRWNTTRCAWMTAMYGMRASI